MKMLVRHISMVLLGVALATPGQARVHHYRRLAVGHGKKLDYALVLPREFDRKRAYPVLLALPPGGQDRAMVEAGVGRYWGLEAARRGWIVVSPVAPDGVLFFKGAEQVLPALMDAIADEFILEGNRFHLAGVSNGGISAFRVAVSWPERFQSLTVLPGFPMTREDIEGLSRLRGMPVHLFAGGDDVKWASAERKTAKMLEDLGIPVAVTVYPGEGHVPASITAVKLFDLLDGLRRPEAP